MQKIYDYIMKDYLLSRAFVTIAFLSLFMYAVDILRKFAGDNYAIMFISTCTFILLIREMIKNNMIKHIFSIIIIIASLRMWINSLGALF
ncbi:hypothetical protein [Natronospora cellulosivora (SeqCode)]